MRKRGGDLGIVASVRRAIAAENLSEAERLLRSYRDDCGLAPEALVALSWLARGSLGAQRFAKAADYARRAHRSIVRRLDAVELDAEPALASALGASIEVLSQVKKQQGHRSEAVRFLKRELAEYGPTSIGTRIRKNLNLLSLEGQPAQELESLEWLGPKPVPLAKLHGRPVLVFFWAHYCGDSRAQGRVLVRVREKFKDNDLVLIGPTRLYGYLDEHRRKRASRLEETEHIQAVLKRHYSWLSGTPVPISERNFYVYGASTTPTLVLVDSAGVVSLYHPGKMPFRELASQIRRVLV